eukprot:1134000-Pyramimonas_sp.AAC.1
MLPTARSATHSLRPPRWAHSTLAPLTHAGEVCVHLEEHGADLVAHGSGRRRQWWHGWQGQHPPHSGM